MRSALFWKKFCFLGALSFAGFHSQVGAAPSISHVKLDGLTLDDSRIISVHGSGFGSKSQAAPNLWVFGSDVRENGVKSSAEVGKSKGNSVAIGKGATASPWSSGVSVMYDDRVRHPGVDHSYYIRNNGYLGGPYVTQKVYSDKLYASFRIRPWGNIGHYHSVSYHSLSGVFDTGRDAYDEGEDVVIYSSTGILSGRIVWLDKEKGIFHLSCKGLNSKNSIDAKIVGVKSKAEAILNPGGGFVSSLASKYFRGYENAWLGGGTRTIFSTNRWIATQLDEAGKEIDRKFDGEGDSGYGVVDLSSIQSWNLVEVFINLSGDKGEGYVDVNNIKRKWFRDLNIHTKPKDVGPTITNLGWEAAGGTDHINVELSFGEIYMDNTPQRVILSTKSTYSEVRDDQEILFPLEWNDSTIVLEAKRGGLPSSAEIFLYVFDSQNNVNANGYRICAGCLMPPAAPSLYLK